MKKIFLLLVLLCYTAASSAAQQSNSTSTNDIPPGAVALERRLSYSNTVSRRYDRFQDRTTIELRNLIVYDAGGVQIRMQAMANFNGTTPTGAPPLIGIGLTVGALTRFRVQDPTLYVVASNVRIPTGPMLFFGEESLPLGMHVAGYLIMLPYDTVYRIAYANRLEMRFDGLEFELSVDHQNALRDFLNYASGAPSATSSQPPTSPLPQTQQPVQQPLVNIPLLAGRTARDVDQVLGRPRQTTRITNTPEQMPGEFRTYPIGRNEYALQVRFYQDRAVSFVFELPAPADQAESALLLGGVDLRGISPHVVAPAAHRWRNVTASGITFADIGAYRGGAAINYRFDRIIIRLTQ